MKDTKMRRTIAYSAKRSLPFLFGFFPVGIAYGIMMSNAGYNFLWAAFTALFVHAGSLQMLMVSFFAGGVPLATIVVTALLLNSRHIFYGLSFIEKFKTYGPWKYFIIYGLCDENYSLLCSYKETRRVYEKWVDVFCTAFIWAYCVIFAGLGGLIGKYITFDTTGIDFALTALFVVILVDQFKSAASRMPMYVAIVSAIVNLLVFGPENFLLPALMVTVILLVILQGKIDVSNADDIVMENRHAIEEEVK